ncbi:unnamed protein product [Gulo gulo]|uniref:Uncharacterized protein n=1 Tax=Gulo gulo TaxID=48420 RepID=A0A9X9LID9_GULGU|nr:unnamed protein product [Gulo gulo]
MQQFIHLLNKMRKLKPKEIKTLAQDDVMNTWWNSTQSKAVCMQSLCSWHLPFAISHVMRHLT